MSSARAEWKRQKTETQNGSTYQQRRRLQQHLLPNGSTIILFFKWAIPGLFFIYFRLFKQTIHFFTTNICGKMLCPSKIWRRDLNPQPSEHEPPPITTRPGLPPLI